MFMTGQEEKRPFNTGDFLIEVTTWTGLIVYVVKCLSEFYISQTCIKRSPLGQRRSGLSRQVTA